ncbi:MAG: radical SAM protein [Candidatus Kerfeldbacteria bacterium]|nr:radical SAM protein [Candidatus Kerfeldbacteria bacterium]
MRLPYLLNPLYRFARRATPERIKPTVRGWYNALNKWATYGRTDIFTALDIETNARCNLQCSYCPVSEFDRGNHYMPDQLFRKIIDDLAAFPFTYKGRLSPHFYGDPLIDVRLPELMRYAHQKLPQAKIIIHTNGIKLTVANYRELVAAGITGFLITRHMRHLPKPVLDILQDEPGAKKYITVQTLDKVGLFNRGGNKPVKTPHVSKSCYYVSDEIAVDYRGYVVCTNDFFVREAFGNVNERSLGAIWWDPEFVSVRQRLRNGDQCLTHCRESLGQETIESGVIPEGARAGGYTKRQTPQQIRDAAKTGGHAAPKPQPALSVALKPTGLPVSDD